MIDRFKEEYEFLSNFYYSPIEKDGIKYPTVEHLFQASKTLDIEDHMFIATVAYPWQAKKLGRSVQLRSDWEQIKDDVMYDAVYRKFTQNPNLKAKLLATGDVQLVEGNTWRDYYWGVCDGVGENRLGQTLMEVRERLKKEGEI